MKFTNGDIKGLILIEQTAFEDSRGYFFEAYNWKRFEQNGISTQFVQDNQSKSSYGVIRDYITS
jgi:dTDP-4-dehydrorhamnose 3,5-epimerase